MEALPAAPAVPRAPGRLLQEGSWDGSGEDSFHLESAVTWALIGNCYN